MKQKHILRIAEKYASFVIPFLYIGLGIYIVVKSDCYPWSIDEIDNQFVGDPGQIVIGVTTALPLSFIMGLMVWLKMRKQSRTSTSNGKIPLAENARIVGKNENDDGPLNATNSKHVDGTRNKKPGEDCEGPET